MILRTFGDFCVHVIGCSFVVVVLKLDAHEEGRGAVCGREKIPFVFETCCGSVGLSFFNRRRTYRRLGRLSLPESQGGVYLTTFTTYLLTRVL